jgi:hypothetical protein
MGAEIVNYNPEVKRAYIAVDVEYLDGKIGKSAIAMPLSVTGMLKTEIGVYDKDLTE